MAIDRQRVSLLVAEKLREIATRQGIVPFRTGDLRKSHVVQPAGSYGARIGSNLPYARAVHDGRPPVVIRPRRAKALMFGGLEHPVRAVHQPARVGQPWLAGAVGILKREGLGFLAPLVGEAATRQLEAALRRSPHFHVTAKKGDPK